MELHLSKLVGDYESGRLTRRQLIASDDAARQICVPGFGNSMLVVRSRGGARSGPVTSTVDHFSVWIDDFASFHLTDPDGYDLQIAGTTKA